MRDLNDLDPLPKLSGAWNRCVAMGYVVQPMSRRARDEEKREWAKATGEDWQPYKRDGQIVPHMYINGKGETKNARYVEVDGQIIDLAKPPEPPETDIPIPCVVVADDYPPPYGTTAWAVWLLTGRGQAEPQTQTASQLTNQEFADEIEASRHGWIPHKPGDPRPTAAALAKFRNGDEVEACGVGTWGSYHCPDYEVVAWKPAT
jgi:hypothetical protein